MCTCVWAYLKNFGFGSIYLRFQFLFLSRAKWDIPRRYPLPCSHRLSSLLLYRIPHTGFCTFGWYGRSKSSTSMLCIRVACWLFLMRKSFFPICVFSFRLASVSLLSMFLCCRFPVRDPMLHLLDVTFVQARLRINESLKTYFVSGIHSGFILTF